MPHDIISNLVVFGATFLVGVLFALAGKFLLSATACGNCENEKKNCLPTGFFFGAAMFLMFYRIVAIVFDSARLGASISFAVIFGCALLGCWQARGLGKVKEVFREFFMISILNVVFALVLGFIFLSQGGSLEDPFTMVGSLHSGRYAALSTFIVQTDHVPLVRQNYGQSLLSSLHQFVGIDSPLSALASWLYLSAAMFAYNLYVIFKNLTEKKWIAWLAVGYVLFSNIALSLTYILIIDSGSPLGFTGYSDVFLGLATWLIFLSILRNPQSQSSRRLILATVLAFSWALSAPQNCVIGLMLVAYKFLIPGQKESRRQHSVLAISVLVGTGIGAVSGGMFLPKSWVAPIDIPGMMQVPASITIHPGQPYLTSHYGKWRWGNMPNTPDDNLAFTEINQGNGRIDRVRRYILLFESRTWESFRLLFFPLIGIIAGLLLRPTHTISTWAKSSLLALGLGFIICFSISIGDKKWELTRFLLPGIMTGLITGAALILVLHEKLKSKVSQSFVVLLLILPTIPPIFETVIHGIRTTREPNRIASFKELLHGMSRSGSELMRDLDKGKP
jgi:hypothetical protein